ncbi:MAG TPA: DMT family transporter [Candidatus Nanopelagicaceae bacterium]
MNFREHKIIPTILLLSVALIWGSTFAIMKDSLGRIDVNSFLAWRFLIAALIMIILKPNSLKHITPAFLLRGIALGLLLGGGYIFQTFGLTQTTVAKTGFITGLYAIFVPLIAATFFRHHISKIQWFAVGLATIGMGILSLNGFSIGLGDFLVLVSALLFALHIIGLSQWSPGRDAYALTLVQMATVGALALLCSMKDGLQVPHDRGVWVAVIYSAILASAYAFMVQTWAQSFMSATNVGIVLTMEYIFAAIFGVVLVHEHVTWRTIVGGMCMMVGLYLVILYDDHKINTSINKHEKIDS